MQNENTLVKAELLKLIAQTKKLPTKIYVCRKGKQTKICRNLLQAGKFFGLKGETMHAFNHYKKNNIGKGRFFFCVKDTAKIISDLSEKVLKLEI